MGLLWQASRSSAWQHTRTRTHTHTHRTHARTHAHTHTPHTHTPHTHVRACTHIHARACTHTQTHTHTHTHTHTNTHTRTPHTQTCRLAHTPRTHTHTHSRVCKVGGLVGGSVGGCISAVQQSPNSKCTWTRYCYDTLTPPPPQQCGLCTPRIASARHRHSVFTGNRVTAVLSPTWPRHLRWLDLVPAS